MKHTAISWLTISGIMGLLFGCTPSEPQAEKILPDLPMIFPDYTEVIIPSNIAPLRFRLDTTVQADEAIAVIRHEADRLIVPACSQGFLIPEKGWKKLIAKAIGKKLDIQVYVKQQGTWTAYQPFHWEVSTDSIDPYLVYRLIEPGYELWNRMGIYQRDLSSFRQTAVLTNEMTRHNCMNCHSFCNQDPGNMLFHMRADLGGTYIVRNGSIEKLNTNVSKEIQSLVYPAWHPSGRYIAFSVNQTRQAFHMNDRNRVEVYDAASDVVIYDTEKREVITHAALSSPAAFETFPNFSPDGKTLYYCTADSCTMPEQFNRVAYSLCALPFDAEHRTLGTEADTLFSAQTEGKSVSFPRVSPDGKFLAFTCSGYGNFSIWHKDADLYLLNLSTQACTPMQPANSADVESYHTWSSNSRWMVFSSRRTDGLYTRPYVVHIDENGLCSKPFILPQETPDFYHTSLYSFNLPELVKGKVELNQRETVKMAEKPGLPVTLGK